MKLLGHSIHDAITLRVRQSNRGQAIILIAFLFIALIAFVGIVVDVGTVLTRYAQLRRTVDAAAVQASNQFRESRALYNGDGSGTTLGKDMYSSAAQVYAAQGFDPHNMRVYACLNSDIDHIADQYNNVEDKNALGDPIANPEFKNTSSTPIGEDPSNSELKAQLCPLPGDPPRKMVRVDGHADVGLPFLSVVGWKYLTVKATSVGEAASVDLVLVLDRSGSMATESKAEGNPLSACALDNSCKPFEQVRSSAKDFIEKLYFPYDRVTIIEFDRLARVWDTAAGAFVTDTTTIQPTFVISGSDGKTTAQNVLTNNFSIQKAGECPEFPGMPQSCVSTNIGGAIKTATRVLAVQGRRRASVWMMLLLTDGAADSTDGNPAFPAGYCPPTAWISGTIPLTNVVGYTGVFTQALPPYAEPTCLRINNTGGSDLAYNQIRRGCIYTDTTKCPANGITWKYPTLNYQYKYDPIDFARDQADYMSNNGIVAFVIGLGPYVSGLNKDGTPFRTTYGGCDHPLNSDSSQSDACPDTRAARDTKAGARLLRYVADMGFDPGEVLANKKWLCHADYWERGAPDPIDDDPFQQCGNYWYAPEGRDLEHVFEEIASRMFTRLSE